jgi:putative ABC transport system ATP-binding protein
VQAGGPAAEARAVLKDYDSEGVVSRALNGVSLTVEAGRFVSVMGPSGSGKSTLLHLLGGLDRPTAGEVLIDGHALSGLSDRDLTILRRHHLGFVFQFFNLVPVLSAEDNIGLPAVIDGQKPAAYADQLERALGLVGLTEHRHKLPSQLSGGQQQRVAIARALFMQPTLLLADEPTGNLDSRTGAEVLRLLREANASLRTTILMVTHDPRAAAMSDEVVMLSDGQIAGRLDLTDHEDGGSEADRTTRVLAWIQALDEVAVG